MSAIDIIESYFRATALCAAQKHTGYIQAFADVLKARLVHSIGPRYYSLFELHSRRTEDWPQYTQDTEINPLLRAIAGQHLGLARDKLAFAEHCIKHQLPAVPIICYITNNEDRALPEKRVKSLTEFSAALRSAPGRIFVKLVAGAHGTDAFSASRKSENEWIVGAANVSVEGMYSHMLEKLGSRSGWLVQPAISPHRGLQRIMPGGLGTVRVITYEKSDNIFLFAPILRLPSNGNDTDNFAEGLTGNIVAPIDLSEGRVGAGITSTSSTWPKMQRFTHHPDTTASIEGTRVPYWKELVELVTSGHRSIEGVKTLGWDIAVTYEGPIIIETNTAYSTHSLQVAHQQGMRSAFSKILNSSGSKLSQTRGSR